MTGAKPQSQSHEPHESQKTQSPYAQLFRIPGTKAFCVSGAIARLPMSMMGLGIVLALNHMYDNWTIAGVMSAAYVLATAAADRRSIVKRHSRLPPRRSVSLDS